MLHALPTSPRRSVVALALPLLLAACGGGSSSVEEPPLLPPLAQDYRPTGKAAAGDVFVHLFEWRWSDIARECETFLGPAGYAGVQISPPSEHAVIASTPSGVTFPWWQRYQTVSYRLENSRSGTLPEFADMVRRCKAQGVAIYADAVINHMTAGAGVGSAGNAYTKYNYPAAGWTAADFHTPACSINSYNDPRQVWLCELVGLADLRTETTSVRVRLANYLTTLHELGVAGFRIDAAKHMQPLDVDYIVASVNAAADAAGRSRPYFFLEVINNPGEAVTAQQYFGVGYASGGASDITDFLYGYRVTDAFLGRGGATLASLQQLTGGLLPSDKAVVFVDNHDNQRSQNLYYASTVGGTPVYELAAMFMLAHPQGAPSVMSSFGFDRATQAGRDRGPPSTAGGVTTSTFDALGATRCTTELGSAQVGQWICEHRRLGIAQMVAFRKATAGAPLTDFRTLDDPNRIAFARAGKGFFALNRSTGGAFALPTTLPDGWYCNVARYDYRAATDTEPAQCGGPPIAVVGGVASVGLPSNTALALHVGARL
jgi:alpha-amylase